MSKNGKGKPVAEETDYDIEFTIPTLQSKGFLRRLKVILRFQTSLIDGTITAEMFEATNEILAGCITLVNGKEPTPELQMTVLEDLSQEQYQWLVSQVSGGGADSEVPNELSVETSDTPLPEAASEVPVEK